eukprot:TCALIF_07059-PB protein Name:"Similar to Trehalase (Apis mellifera)" AED:0.31 eAED:0.31 QI:0/0.7/0.81/0.81/0.8/0.81/11/303/598
MYYYLSKLKEKSVLFDIKELKELEEIHRLRRVNSQEIIQFKMQTSSFGVVVLFGLLGLAASDQFPQPCEHPIYCLGGENSLLHTVQMARLYNDSKTFVDKPTRYDQGMVLFKFEQMMTDFNNKPSKKAIEAFVDANFSPEGTEFEDWEPTDWHENPAFLESIKDKKYRDLAIDIHGRWNDLGRKIRSNLRESTQTSLIYLEKPFIVPGGRFREMYYWDTYWTILGLIQSEMPETTKGMLENFAHLIKLLGHIPNGNRIYYNRRSQPPLFISMVDEYHKATGDDTFVESLLDSMDREFQFWLANRTEFVTLNNKEYRVAVYNVEVDGPRPESYREDYNDAQQHFGNSDDQLEFYMNMKSGAESGWDYSTRWFVRENGEDSQELSDIATRHIVPVDLNSYLCRGSSVMARLYKRFGNDLKANEYQGYFQSFEEALENVMWNEEKGSWFDFDLLNKRQRPYFYPSNAGPLWANCYPNAWPPMQEFIVTALENTGDHEATEIAGNLVKRWVKNIFVSYEQSSNDMFEKYDVEQIGLPGGGGEYDVQEGFGWTNGVLLDFLSKYGDKLSSDDEIYVNSSGLLEWNLFQIVLPLLVTASKIFRS